MTVTWRAWLAVAIGIVAYSLLGVLATSHPGAEGAIYGWGEIAVVAGVLAYLATYTILTRGRWLRDSLGFNLAMLEIGQIPGAAVYAWVFLANHGSLTNPGLGWIAISSPWWAFAFLMWRNVVFVRVPRDDNEGGTDERVA